MKAQILAGALGLSLYKIDLSMAASKDIGATEKNLRRLFNEAATSNAVLSFDGADGLFGERSEVEVEGAHDHYANLRNALLSIFSPSLCSQPYPQVKRHSSCSRWLSLAQ